ncbi:hypothetical protein QJQ45_001410 [Haematococcus lacustris]|nr:hypothetical protein QJQ45_001410 [Haematococcus lacustris]
MPGSSGINPYAQLIEDADGLDKVEALQDHPNEDLYEKAVHILEAYFDIDEGEDQNLAPAVTQEGGYAFGAPAPAAAAQPGAFNFGADASATMEAPTGMPQFNFAQQQLKDFCKYFANPNFKTCYNQLQRHLVRPGQHRHPMLMPVFEDPSNQALLAKLQDLGSINLAERFVNLYAKAARAQLGWSGEEAQLFIKMACGYGINAKSSELKAAALDKGHVADLIEEADKHRRLLGMKKQGSLEDTLPLPCRMRHAMHVCRWLEQWQQPHTLTVPGQPKRGKRRGVGPRTLTCPPPFTLTPMARVGVHFVKVDNRVLHGVCKQLGLTKETRATFTSEPALSHNWARWFNTNKLHNKGLAFERTVDTHGVSVCVHYTRPLPPPPAPPPAASSSSKRPSVAAAAAHAVGLPHIGKGIAETREYVFDPNTQIGLEEDMAEVSMERHGHAKQLVVFFGAASIGTGGGWGADAVVRACCKVVCRPRGAGQRRGRVMLVDEHRTTRVSSAVNGKQPCEEELNKLSATRPADWKPPSGQVEQRLAPGSSQAATQSAASEPGPSTPPPAKRSKRTEAEPAAEPAQPTKGKGKAKGKADKAKPAPQPGRWLDRDCNAALNMQRIGESRWRPLELCYWKDQGALPAKGKEYPGLGYKRLRDKPPKAQQQQQPPAVAQ